MKLILSIDGGGIRGTLTAKLLAMLEAKRPFLKDVHLFAGTSTGGLLALGLAAEKTPTELLDVYLEHGPKIFSERDALDSLVGPADETWRANYGLDALRTAVTSILPAETTLADLLPRHVLIPTFDLGDGERPWKAKFLHNFEGDDSDGEVLAVDAALRTSAAPTYFPSKDGFIDGGVAANNPSTCALAEALSQGMKREEIRLLSLGTGYNPHHAKGGDWGYLQWARRLIPLWFDGMTDVARYQCEQILGESFYRLDVNLREVIDMDDGHKIDRLVELANQQEEAVEKAAGWVEAVCGG